LAAVGGVRVALDLDLAVDAVPGRYSST
jgi:hypothetical protein